MNVPGAPADRGAYVALGDSISIDDYAGGPGRGGPSLLARNRDDDFPAWQRRDLATLRPDLGFSLLAVDGGTTQSLLDGQLRRLEQAAGPPQIATLSVGGNDVLAAFGDTRRALEIVDVVHTRVTEALRRLRVLMPPERPIVVMTVYDPSDGGGDTERAGLPPWPEVVTVLGHLNAALRAAAAAHDAAVADLHARFLGHGLSRGHPGQADARPADRELFYCRLIEPNAWGANAIREVLWNTLEDGPRPPA